ncbi:MAG: protein translocase subunit SecF [Candidatus Neoclostridium sp.]
MKIFESGKFNIVQKRKQILIVPLVIIAITAICALIFGLTTGNAANVGTDFTGGYVMRVQIGDQLTDENYGEYSDKIVEIAEGLTDENGNKYGLKVTKVERYGNNNDSIAISYNRIKGLNDEDMNNVINPALNQEIVDKILKDVPEVSYSDTAIVATYARNVAGIDGIMENSLKELGVNVVGTTTSENTLTINIGAPVAESVKDKVLEALTLSEPYTGNVTSPGYVSSTVSSELLQRAILAVVIAIVCMLIYIWIRFELLSGLAAIIALFHDLIMMMCGMLIFHIEINQTIIAAIITILGYSINNTIIIFDRVRENVKAMSGASNESIINTSVQSTLSRTIFSTLTTLVMILFVAIIGVTDIRIFALPIIFGLVAGFFSATCIAPSIWSWLSDKFYIKGVNRKNKA